MVVCEEHQGMMGDHISLIRMARQHHLPTDCLFGRGHRHLFTLFIYHQSARFTAYSLMWPEYQCNHLTLESLLTQTFSQISCKFTDSSACFVSISGVMKTHAGVLTERRSIWHNQIGILTTGYLVDPYSQAAQSSPQPVFGQYRHLRKRCDPKITQVRHQFRNCHWIYLFAFAFYLRQPRRRTRNSTIFLLSQFGERSGRARASSTQL